MKEERKEENMGKREKAMKKVCKNHGKESRDKRRKGIERKERRGKEGRYKKKDRIEDKNGERLEGGKERRRERREVRKERTR